MEKVDECGGVGSLGPPGEEPVEEERGLTHAAGPVEEQRLRHARADCVVVEDGLEDGPRDHAPRPTAGGHGGAAGDGRVLWGSGRRGREERVVMDGEKATWVGACANMGRIGIDDYGGLGMLVGPPKISELIDFFISICKFIKPFLNLYYKDRII